MKVYLNGDPIDLATPNSKDGSQTTIRALLRAAGIAEERGLAVAIDSEVIRRGEWDSIKLAEGQRVEVLRAVQGG